MSRLQVLLGLAGLSVSLYAVYIERSKHNDDSYAAYCDLDKTFACSEVLTSRYGGNMWAWLVIMVHCWVSCSITPLLRYSMGMGLVRIILGEDHFLNIPNAYYGVVFYMLVIVLGECRLTSITRNSWANYNLFVGSFLLLIRLL